MMSSIYSFTVNNTFVQFVTENFATTYPQFVNLDVTLTTNMGAAILKVLGSFSNFVVSFQVVYYI